MENKYSKKEFDGYTHRFIVKFKIDNDWRNDTNLNIYSNNGSKNDLKDFINAKKSNKVIGFEVIHRATKEQDEITELFIKETLDNI